MTVRQRIRRAVCVGVNDRPTVTGDELARRVHEFQGEYLGFGIVLPLFDYEALSTERGRAESKQRERNDERDDFHVAFSPFIAHCVVKMRLS